MNYNPLFPERLLLILLASGACGTLIGVLAYLAGDNIPTAIIAGLVAFAGSIAFLHTLVGDPSRRSHHDGNPENRSVVERGADGREGPERDNVTDR